MMPLHALSMSVVHGQRSDTASESPQGVQLVSLLLKRNRQWDSAGANRKLLSEANKCFLVKWGDAYVSPDIK